MYGMSLSSEGRRTLHFAYDGRFFKAEDLDGSMFTKADTVARVIGGKLGESEELIFQRYRREMDELIKSGIESGNLDYEEVNEDELF